MLIRSHTTSEETTTRYTELMKSWFEPGMPLHGFAGKGKYHGLRFSISTCSCKPIQGEYKMSKNTFVYERSKR